MMTTPAARLAALSNAALDDMAPEELEVLAQEALQYDGATAGQIEHTPTGDTPIAMAITEMSNPTYPVVYDRFTGEPSYVNRSMLGAQLQKRDARGRRVFTTSRKEVETDPATGQPTIPWRGKEVCLLHVDAENRAEYDAMGLPTCTKANLVNTFQVNNHLQSKHKQEAAAIKAVEDAAIADEERLVRQALIKANMPETPVAAPVEPEVLVTPVFDTEAVNTETVIIETEVFDIKVEEEEITDFVCHFPDCDYEVGETIKKGKKAGQPLSYKRRQNAMKTHKRVHGH